MGTGVGGKVGWGQVLGGRWDGDRCWGEEVGWGQVLRRRWDAGSVGERGWDGMGAGVGG